MKGMESIRLYYLNDENRLASASLINIAREQRRVKYNEITVIVLITIFLLLFFAQNLMVFVVLLISGLIVGIFGLVKNRKKRILKEIKEFLLRMFLLKSGAKGSWR